MVVISLQNLIALRVGVSVLDLVGEFVASEYSDVL
ncbi:MAG: hypothetical protein RL101_541, partial [Actinomycetota bacterium]